MDQKETVANYVQLGVAENQLTHHNGLTMIDTPKKST